MSQMIVRTGKQRYLTAKYIATFISGGLTMVVPLITNFMLTALFVPAIKPVPTYDTTYGVFGNSIFSRTILYTSAGICIAIPVCGFHVLWCSDMSYYVVC